MKTYNATHQSRSHKFVFYLSNYNKLCSVEVWKKFPSTILNETNLIDNRWHNLFIGVMVWFTQHV